MLPVVAEIVEIAELSADLVHHVRQFDPAVVK
jgi:hypothetical protein